jgi:hypothetical protein
MAGFEACEVDTVREKKYALRRTIELRNREAILLNAKLYDASFPAPPRVPLPEPPKVYKPKPIVLKPPPDYPLDLQRARVSDDRGTTYVWRSDCGNDIAGDHEVSGGWEDPGDSRNYLAYGRAKIKDRWRRGLIALAFPDGNRLRARWPLAFKPGSVLRFAVGLTDTAARQSRTGADVRIRILPANPKDPLLAANLLPGRRPLLEKSYTATGREKELILEIGNRGSEFWSVVYLDVSLEPGAK